MDIRGIKLPTGGDSIHACFDIYMAPGVRLGLRARRLGRRSRTGAALSADAQKIVDLVKKENPTLKPTCSDQDKLRTAVTEATTSLYKEGALTGNPKLAGQEAGKYLYENCS